MERVEDGKSGQRIVLLFSSTGERVIYDHPHLMLMTPVSSEATAETKGSQKRRSRE